MLESQDGRMPETILVLEQNQFGQPTYRQGTIDDRPTFEWSKETTRTILTEALEKNDETWDDIEEMELRQVDVFNTKPDIDPNLDTDTLLDEEVDTSYGDSWYLDFYVLTKKSVYTTHEYDGSISVERRTRCCQCA